MKVQQETKPTTHEGNDPTRNLTLKDQVALQSIFNSIDRQGRKFLSSGQFYNHLAEFGILKSDPRLKEVNKLIDDLQTKIENDKKILPEYFKRILLTSDIYSK